MTAEQKQKQSREETKQKHSTAQHSTHNTAEHNRTAVSAAAEATPAAAAAGYLGERVGEQQIRLEQVQSLGAKRGAQCLPTRHTRIENVNKRRLIEHTLFFLQKHGGKHIA